MILLVVLLAFIVLGCGGPARPIGEGGKWERIPVRLHGTDEHGLPVTHTEKGFGGQENQHDTAD